MKQLRDTLTRDQKERRSLARKRSNDCLKHWQRHLQLRICLDVNEYMNTFEGLLDDTTPNDSLRSEAPSISLTREILPND